MAVNGIDLIIPTSIAHTSGSASINAGGSVTFTGVTALSLNGVFSSAYDNYIVDMWFDVSTGVSLYVRMRESGTDNTTSNSYVTQQLFANGTSVSAARVTELSAYGLFATSNAVQRSGSETFFYGPALAQPTAYRTVQVNDFSSARTADIAGTHNQSTAYDGFTLLPFGGPTMTGLIKVYGLVK
jgi:hypothetical protein